MLVLNVFNPFRFSSSLLSTFMIEYFCTLDIDDNYSISILFLTSLEQNHFGLIMEGMSNGSMNYNLCFATFLSCALGILTDHARYRVESHYFR